jgi:hypothetical protein
VIKQKVRIREVREMGKEARRLMGVEEFEKGKEGEDSLPWLIIMLLSFLPRGTPLHQIRLRIILSRKAISQSPAQDVQFTAMLKINLQMQALVVQMNTRVNQAQGQVAANQIARQAQAAAQGAANVDRFRPAAPPKYGNKKKGEHVDHWISVIEDYLRIAPDADYIRLASSYWEGGPRALWTNFYEAYKRANGGAEPPNPRHFFRQTLEANYGLQDSDQKYWDTWNSVRMGPSQSVAEYNVDFQQALTDLAGHVTDEQVKIEKYRASLQHDLGQLCRTSPTGARWARLQDLMQFATLQWPMVQKRIAKSKKSSQEPTKVEGKRKASGSAGAKGSGCSSKPKLGASGKMSNEQYQKDMAEKLCHICHQLEHVARNCPQNKKAKKGKGGEAAAASGSRPEDEMSDGDFRGSRCRGTGAYGRPRNCVRLDRTGLSGYFQWTDRIIEIGVKCSSGSVSTVGCPNSKFLKQDLRGKHSWLNACSAKELSE